MKDIFSYDHVPYPGKIFLQTHPEAMATMATVVGMTPAPVETCRVLELGCGNGVNLISHAYNLPGAEFVGIDLAENPITHAKISVKELNLQNIEFHQMDVMEMSVERFGKFDYIVAHGLLSWVPDFVRVKILALYREILTENGVGYLSYNAYPGMRHRQMSQDIMKYHAAHFENSEEKIKKSAAFLAFLGDNCYGKDVYGQILQEEVKRIATLEPGDIYHDNLAEVNQPFYFYEFAEMLKQNDLQYVSETQIQNFGRYDLSSDARVFINSLDDIVEREQYLDFLRGRIFRQTLFCRREIQLNHQLSPAILDKFLVTSEIAPLAENPEIASDKPEKFTIRKEGSIEINHPLTKTALVYLKNIYGQAIAFPELLEKAHEILESAGCGVDDMEKHREIAGELFLQICLASDLIEVHVFQPKASTKLSEKPRVNELTRWQALQSRNVTTLLNYGVTPDAIYRCLIELLDGTRSRETAIAELGEFIKTSDDIKNKQEILTDLPEAVAKELEIFARLGMFVA